MKVTITSIELKNPFKFFVLSIISLKIVRQLKLTNCRKLKNTGFWTKHYTMTLWDNLGDMRTFATSGAHLKAMRRSKEISKEIRTITIDASELPKWNEAKELLNNGKVIRF
jgi:hypothetical protein